MLLLQSLYPVECLIAIGELKMRYEYRNYLMYKIVVVTEPVLRLLLFPTAILSTARLCVVVVSASKKFKVVFQVWQSVLLYMPTASIIYSESFQSCHK